MGLCLNCALCVTSPCVVWSFMFVSFGFCLVLFFIEVEAAVFYKDDFFFVFISLGVCVIGTKTVF